MAGPLFKGKLEAGKVWLPGRREEWSAGSFGAAGEGSTRML